MAMKVATWNINGVRARTAALEAWLREAKPDVVCLQEIKTVDEGFPYELVESLGYQAAVFGQKGFNGVALVSRLPLEDVLKGLPGDPADEQSRYIEAVVSTRSGVVRIAGLYLPNGNPIGTDKFSYKLSWMERLQTRVTELLALEEPLVVIGDYNVIPTPLDARRPEAWVNDALFQPESRAAFRRLTGLGLTDAVRATTDGQVFTFWDYQAGARQRNDGIRIDHILASPQAADRIISVGIDEHVRDWDKPSDHVPVWVELDVEI